MQRLFGFGSWGWGGRRRLGEDGLDLEGKDIERLVPERVGQSVLRRVAAAGDQAKTLADAVAVLGEATLQEAAQLAGLDEFEAVTAADDLVGADILVPGPHLRFAHPLLRQAVRAQISPARRALAHGRAARLLGERGSPLARIAAHLREALARGDPWVVETLPTAAAREREQGSPETAVLLLARALAEPPPPHLRFRVTLALAEAQAQTGHPDAVTTARQALALAGGPTDEAEATLHLARTLALGGDFWSAVDLLDKQATAPTALDPDLALQVEAELLDSARLHGDTREEALARLDRLSPVALPPRPASVVLLANLALTGLERSEAPERVAQLAQLALSEDWLVESGSFQFAYAGEALMFVAGAIAEALIAIGLIEGGEHGIRRLREAVDLLEGSPRVLTRVRGQTELGSMLRRNCNSRAARGYLVKALDLAHHHGAIALGDRAREELVIAGGRPRRPAVTGIAALTPSERRVARFVNEGLTNRQIAGRLFISARTVSAHLTHIYQKLGVTSRAELNAVLKGSV